MSAYIVLETGQVFEGKSFGYTEKPVSSEIVFQTGMVGYTESLTDPSYKNQLLVLTYPLIGNYGIPSDERDKYGFLKFFESEKVYASGLIVGEYINNFSHWNADRSLSTWLKEHKVPGISGIDTRELTKIIREYGTIMGKIVFDDRNLNNNINCDMKNLVEHVTTSKVIEYNPNGDKKILVIDCGIKYNQLRMLLNRNVYIKMIHYDYNFLEDFENENYDGVFISNGPGDPSNCMILVNRLKELMENYNIPIFGICLGHQILALAAGCSSYKMKFGNRGHNIPCQLVGTQKCYITTQNHGYAINNEDLPEEWNELFVNANDGSNEGIYHKSKPYFSVQFHPEANGGPRDTSYLFDIFLENKMHKLLEKPQELSNKKYRKVLVLGSGGLSIGQSGEFDYSGSQAIKAYKEEGLNTILINPNIATVQTSPGFADKVYFLPVNKEFVTKVIKQERPDCIAVSFGGQTGLNCAVELYKTGILEKYNVDILGTSIETVIITEDREAFKNKLLEHGERTPEGFIGTDYYEAYNEALKIGFPVLVRSGFALGGLGSGFAHDKKELSKLLKNSLANSPQVTIDKDLRGWKEVEYEIVRDRYDNCISVCNMENIDPLGVHTGESMVVAPSQTLTDEEYHMLRSVGINLVRHLGIVGECNIQYALDKHSKKYRIIEINARLSRSSALASKATGYPLAYVASKLGLGYSLLELRNSITKSTTSCFEPSLDYCVIKVPRWDLDKFPLVSTKIDSSMKSIGEAMAISRNFEEAFQKALRMANNNVNGFEPNFIECNDEVLINPTFRRIFALATGLYSGEYNIEKIHSLSSIDTWFLNKFQNIINMMKVLENNQLDTNLLANAKKLGFSDKQIASCTKTIELAVRQMREKNKIYPVVKQIDTVAGEFPCFTNYLYTTYSGSVSDIELGDYNNDGVIVLGSGVYKIGSSVEFDWCSVNCIRELRNLDKKVIVVNCNPETVSTDYDEADKLYFEELSFETVMDIYQLENPLGIVLAMGGQIPNNIAMPLYRQHVNVIGTSPEMIDNAENRYKFSRMLDSMGIDQPKWKELTSFDEAKIFCHQVGYPCLVRPSYVLSGAAMNVAYSNTDLEEYLGNAVAINKDYPVVISKFINDAKEVEVDAIASNGELVLTAISEHVENAGVHSGDATLILPPHDLTEETMNKIRDNVYKIANALNINGPFNIQFIAKDDDVKVIECNLRVSRTFPFVSKTLGVNFIRIATKIMMGYKFDIPELEYKNIGVKVPKFSFNRLKDADISLGVEMLSTGEVACFGTNHYEAYLKGLISTEFKLPEIGVLLSLGTFKFKNDFLPCVKILKRLGYKLYGTHGTADFLNENGIKVVELPLYSSNSTNKDTILNYIADKKIDLVINTSEKNKIRCVDNSTTDGYRIRRMAVESSVSIITDIKCAKLFVNSLNHYFKNGKNLKLRSDVDCFTSYETIRLPGLIDVHVHVRDPGATYKEDWTTCTQSALAGGITTIFAMPNTNPAITSHKPFELVHKIAKEKACCDYGIFLGANSDNINTIHKLSENSVALKMYLNQTFGPLILENTITWANHIKNWSDNRPICVHAESKTLPAVLFFGTMYKKHIHVCHVAREEEITAIKLCKEKGENVTCEVAPHHLFMNIDDLNRLGCCGEVRPRLMKKSDQEALWNNMDIIDCFATDHAPHTIKDKHEKTTPGFPGLETALPLLLTAVKQGRLTLHDVINKYHNNPKKIFDITTDKNTFIEVDFEKEWTIGKPKFSKCGWTPFEGFKVQGIVRRVVMRGKTVFIDGQITCKPGSGRLVSHVKNTPHTNRIIKQKVQNPIPTNKFLSTHLELKNIIDVCQFDRDNMRILFEKANRMKKVVRDNRKSDILKGLVMGSVFYEPSTRTRCSFSVAMKRLGGEVIEINSNESSVRKGETIEDFARCIECYTDIMVLRSPEIGSVSKVSDVLNIPLINAGDGIGEHPTQALLDVYTIREEIGTVNNLTITIVGDLKNGRAVHSLAKLLSVYNVRLRYVSPKSLEIPKNIYDYIAEKGVEQTEHTELNEVIETTDILYITRIQRERFENDRDYEKVKGSYIINPETLTKAKSDVRILHPLPRVDEISTDLDSDPRAAYFRQMENGLYLRMAILSTVFGK